jgi:hypothetical protein
MNPTWFFPINTNSYLFGQPFFKLSKALLKMKMKWDSVVAYLQTSFYPCLFAVSGGGGLALSSMCDDEDPGGMSLIGAPPL